MPLRGSGAEITSDSTLDQAFEMLTFQNILAGIIWNVCLNWLVLAGILVSTDQLTRSDDW